ncbi:hypothetical protein B0E33_18995 [Roseibium algicola]|uniref:Type IV secretory pathway VirD2 relaxase n=1 Tax=Roseibium algicola TaxID=2857014 RepID=A0ABN4X0Z1_9HYPH|nr:DUF3363 domain-containing protein [Roseibium aggregatum]AQQ05401.1 hypothetical protein B0E33_18995 [Roseibium aggregatum]
MSRDKDDVFRPKPGRIRSLGGTKSKSYLNRVLHQMSAERASGASPKLSTRFTGRRIGRGNDWLNRHRAGHRFAPATRRVVIKSRIVKLAGRSGRGGLGAARAHLRYLQRDGVSREQEPGRLYDANSNEADGRAFLKRSEDDRHQFRFIVSPEDAVELEDLKPFVRDLMRSMEQDLGTKLDWVAVDHFNTAQPHSHILLRGRDDQGKDLIIARDYIGHGMRRRASELLTLELGPQTEQEFRQKLARQVGQDRFTDLDRRLLRQAGNGLLDVGASKASANERSWQTLKAGRLRVLEQRGLANEVAPGQWQLSAKLEATLRRAGERGDIIKTMHRGLKAAGLDAGASDYAIFDPGDPRSRTVTGQVIDRGLHDELNEGHYILVDGADGRVHHVALDPRQDMEDLPLGAVVAVEPVGQGIKEADRIIADLARQNGGIYAPEVSRSNPGEVSEEVVKTHIRRLEALRRQGIVQRNADGSWKIPDDFEERITGLAMNETRFPARATALSYLSLEAQVGADGATWLDRQLLDAKPLQLRGGRFGSRANSAIQRRQEHLIEQGLAERKAGRIRFRRNLLQFLRQRELSAVGAKLSNETGLTFVETPDGERAEGVYKRSVKLASGRFAILEKSKEFNLVPWRPVLERQRGKLVSGRLRGASMSFDFSRKRGMGIG